MSQKFKEFYKGPKYSVNEDEELYKALKRQISAYLNESTFERLHSIFNKIFLLRKNFSKNAFYDILLKEMNTEQKKTFIQYVLSEGFGKDENKVKKEDIWELQLQRILKIKNTKKEETHE